jgi:hypothetical protein
LFCFHKLQLYAVPTFMQILSKVQYLCGATHTRSRLFLDPARVPD